jgi:diacylglycerol kinase (ATP)
LDTSRAPFSFQRRLGSFRYAWSGIRVMLATQCNAWIHAAISIAVVVAGFVFALSRLEWCAIVLAMMAVWTAEAMNTALEFLCDVTSAEFHPLIEKAKDVAAAAVLISAIGAVVVGLLVFCPHFRGH